MDGVPCEHSLFQSFEKNREKQLPSERTRGGAYSVFGRTTLPPVLVLTFLMRVAFQDKILTDRTP